MANWLQRVWPWGKQSPPPAPNGEPEKKANPAYAQYSSMRIVGQSQPVYASSSYGQLARDGYMRSIVAHRCIDMIATASAGIPWHLYTRGKKKEMTDHPLLERLKAPNPEESGSDLLAKFVAYYKLAGNAYLYANRLKRGEPGELWALRPDRVAIVPSPLGVQQYEYRINGTIFKYDAADIFHHKRFHPLDDLYGLSELAVSHQIVQQQNAGDDRNMALLQNAARPSGGLFAKEVLSDSDFDRLNQEILENYAGVRNSGMPLLFDGDVKWQPLGLSPMELDWLRSRVALWRDVCVGLGVPSILLGDSEAKTYANYETALKALYTETVLPNMDRIRDGWNRWLVPMYGDNLYLDYDRNDIEALQENRDGVSTRVGQQWSLGGLTLNEYRKAIGQPEVQGGDFFKFTAGKEAIFVPVDRLQEYVEAMAERAINPPTPPPAQLPQTTITEEDQPQDGEQPRQLPPGKKPAAAKNDTEAVKALMTVALAAIDRKDQNLASIRQVLSRMLESQREQEKPPAPVPQPRTVVIANKEYSDFYKRFEEEEDEDEEGIV